MGDAGKFIHPGLLLQPAQALFRYAGTTFFCLENQAALVYHIRGGFSRKMDTSSYSGSASIQFPLEALPFSFQPHLAAKRLATKSTMVSVAFENSVAVAISAG